MDDQLNDKKIVQQKRPLGNLINLYAALVLIDIAVIIIGILGSFWLFIIGVIALPIVIGGVKMSFWVSFASDPKESAQQIGTEVVKPIIKSKLIWGIIIVGILVLIAVSIYTKYFNVLAY